MSAYPPAAEDCHGKVVLCRMVLTIGGLVKQGQDQPMLGLVLPTRKERLAELIAGPYVAATTRRRHSVGRR